LRAPQAAAAAVGQFLTSHVVILVGTLDKVIPPYAQIFMAQRANAQIVQVKASHPSMISHPDAAANLIGKAARTVGGGD
jgi:hypothetical protein